MYQFISLLAFTLFIGCSSTAQNSKKTEKVIDPVSLSKYETAYFASGCFWCVEAVYESVNGVAEVISGYSGGKTTNPTYQAVGTGATGHAEAVEVYYDTTIVSFETLLDVYYGSQDPTTYGQRPDLGSQYRSIIFYKNEFEKMLAEKAKAAVSSIYTDPIVTEIIAFEKFYPAEDYHQDFEKRNPNQSYVKAVSIPRLKRFQAKFPDILKTQ